MTGGCFQFLVQSKTLYNFANFPNVDSFVSLYQADGTYTHNIESLVHKVCALAHESGDDHQKRCLRASSLQCLSAMVYIFDLT